MDRKIMAGIVTFNPELSRLKKNVEAIADQVDMVVIVDNASDNIYEIDGFQRYTEIVLIKNSKNVGIAKALNILMDYAQKNLFEWVLTLDQDSVSTKSMIHIMLALAPQEYDIGIISPFIKDINRNDVIKRIKSVEEVKRCITSGSLTNTRIWNNIGGFDEKMFIDGVDFDYCCRLIKNGYRIIKVNEAELWHELGHIEIRRVAFLKIVVKNHNALRKFYIAKNIVYLDRKSNARGYPIKTILREIKQMLIVLFFENNKKEKLLNIWRGMFVGFREEIKV